MIERQISLDEKLDLSGRDLAIGFFDGLHVGHRLLLSQCLKDNHKPTLLTFDPKEMLSFRRDKTLLYTPEERHLLFEQAGIETTYILPFDERTRNADKDEFLSFLSSSHPRLIVVGEDFTFGRMALGKAKDIPSAVKDIPVIILPLSQDEKGKISSTRIKETIRMGDITEANRLLGAPFFALGKVIHGKGNGHLLGFPTANLPLLIEKVYPPCGVYKTRTTIDGKTYPSMTNIGTHPTIDETATRFLETHVLSYHGDLYGKTIAVTFLEKIRDQKKFSSLDELRRQLTLDARRCSF